MTFALLIAAFMMGFLGSPHCLGMCGGIVSAFGLSMQNVSVAKQRGLMLTYHIGRLISYSVLGLVAALLGATVLAPFMQSQLPRILLGGVLVLIGAAMLGLPWLNSLERLGLKLWQSLAPLRQKVFPITSFSRALAAGLLWGFLPCGLVYGALMMAVVGHDVPTGMLLMFVFGLGTTPMLLATGEAVAWLEKRVSKYRLHLINGVILILSGLAIVFVPIVMHTLMHHDHSGMGHDHMGHGSMDHSTMMHEGMDHDMSANENHSQMDHSQMDHSQMDHSQMDHSQMDHSQMDHSQMDHSQMDHSQMDHSQMDHSQMDHSQMDHSQMDHSQMDHSQMDHSQMDHSQMDHSQMDHS